MRTTEARAGAPRPHPFPGRASVVVVATTFLLTLAAGLVGPASAQPATQPVLQPQEPRTPTKQQVERSRERAQDAATDVAAVRRLLVQADAELEAASVRAAQAFEAYNGARWELEQATEALAQARREARTSAREAARQRSALAGLVASSYEGAGELSAVQAVLGDDGPEGVMERLLTHEGATSSLEADHQRFTATAALAETFREEAEAALGRQRTATEAADDARRAAEDAAAAAEATAASIAAEKDRLVARLAALQGISVRLAQRRQQVLQEQARQRAVEEAAREAREAREARQEPTTAPGRSDGEERGGGGESAPAPEPSTPAPPPTGGVGRVLDFARAQLGEPYVWGAAGPSSWDCSGLTMEAWRAAGVSLPHYSVAQYDATTPISVDQLRAGDLVFWGSGSDPSSIFHVALYLGDGQIIHAPRTGRPVSIDSLYYWVPPTFYGRV